MRWGAHYGNALNAGANSVGLYIAPVFLFRPAHPPLFIPWSEIKVGPSRWVDFYLSITLTLGREEQIPFRVSRRLARKLRNDAGESWPDPKNDVQLRSSRNKLDIVFVPIHSPRPKSKERAH